MNTNNIIRLMAVCGALLATSCVQRIADLTFMSTKNVDMNHPGGYYTAPNQRSEGVDTAHIIVCFPTRIPNVKEAVDRAIEKNGPTCIGLSNMKLEHGFWYIPYIYGREYFKATGDPVYKH